MCCMSAVSERHLERHLKHVPRALIVTAAGRFTCVSFYTFELVWPDAPEV